MARRGRVPMKLDIVGLDPSIFSGCMRAVEALVESRKGSVTSSESEVSGSKLDLYNKIAGIALDFQRAYGRAVQIRIFNRSPNKLIDRLLKIRRSTEDAVPEFYVNGVKVFKGVPESFSQLDESIENAFRRS